MGPFSREDTPMQPYARQLSDMATLIYLLRMAAENDRTACSEHQLNTAAR
jgi:hypothetical protein